MPTKPKIVQRDLRFPVGGINRRYGYQYQAPYTTPTALNVRPFDSLERRERGGSRPGLAKAYANQLSGPVQLLRPVMIVDQEGNQWSRLMAIAGGTIGLWNESGVFSTVSGTLNVNAKSFQAAQIGTQVIIANLRDSVLSGTKATASISATNHLGDSAVADWTALGIDTALDSCFVYDIADELVATYPIASVAVGYIVLTKSGAALPTGACSYRIGRRIAVYDTDLGTLAPLLETFGVYPLQCKLMAKHQDRLILAGPDNGWYASRQGDASDWDYAYDPEDVARPVAGGMDPNMPGLVPEPVRALIPASGDKLIFGCDESLWLASGQLGTTGQLSALSHSIGVVDANSWCSLPDGGTLILSRDGIYAIAAGPDSFPVAISPEVIPADLKNFDATNNALAMIYDPQGRGVHIFVTPHGNSDGQHWWFDLGVKGFWRDSFPRSQQPTAVARYASAAGGASVALLGGKDGYVRKFDPTSTTDDGTAIDSSIVYGPIALGQGGSTGKVLHLDADLDASSGPVDWEFQAADTPEAALAFASPTEGEWAAGKNCPDHHVGRGSSGAIRLSATGQWAIERIGVTVAPSGRTE